jgi:plastocyanin/sugar lactone lactonase YvrE
MPLAAQSQDTSSPSSAGIALVASALTNPRGFTWGADGTLYVSQAGTGGERASPGDSPQEQADGIFHGGLTGSVVRIEDGCPVVFQGDLPSTRGASGHDQGVSAIAFLDGKLYALEDGGGVVHGNPETPNGVYLIDGSGAALLVADTSAWVRANPVAHLPGDYDPDGETFAMVAGDDELWVIESNSGQLLRITPDGTIARVVDLSDGHPVPTGIAVAPDGGLYVGFLTPAPFPDGASKVIKIGEDGSVSDVWTGLTAVTAIAVGPDGTLYALEMATGNTTTAPFIAPSTGKVVRQTGPDSKFDVAVGFDFPIAMAVGPDGGLYVGFPAFGVDGAIGGIVRIDLAQGETLRMTEAIIADSPCPGAGPVATPAATAAVTPAASPSVTPDPAGTPDSGGGRSAGAVAIEIKNFAFNQSSVTVPVGTTVTWTNHDTASHTVTAAGGAFDSGNLSPGQSYSFTLEQTGSFAYACNYHPNMQGTVVVQ